MGVARWKVPAALARLERRFAAWRKSRSVGERIPERLWEAAVEVAAHHGLNRTASILRLEYYSLKKRVDRHRPSRASFVELPSPTFPVTNECVIEMEDARGARMRVHLKGQNLPDLLALSRLFWDGE
jgi:hypothetical protein